MYTSIYSNIDIPEQDLITFVLEKDYNYDPQKPLFIDTEDVKQQHSLTSVRHDARRLAHELRTEYGIHHGDVVAIYSPNSIAYPAIVFGTFYASGTVTLINPVYRASEVAYQLKDSRAKVICTTKDLMAETLSACSLVGLDPRCILLLDDWRDTNGLLASQQQDGQIELERLCRPEPSDLAFLCYSSGTTGLSKGVQLTHKNFISNLVQWDSVETSLDTTSSLLSILPFSHIYALHVLLFNTIRRGMTSYILARFSASRFLGLIEQYRITAAFIVPPIAKVMISSISAEYDLSSIEFLCSGAAPLSRELAQALSLKYGVAMSQGYGMTETSPVLCYGQSDHSSFTGSVGRLLPNIELRVVDELGSDVSDGPGELQVRGPNVMQGYLNNAEANAAAFTTDGFFRTGDLGYVSEDGHVYIVDRLKELIKYKGFQVPPVELENLLLTHPAIEDCAVVGRECQDEVTELPTAYCVLKPEVLNTISPLPEGWIDPASVIKSTSHGSLAKEIIEFVAQKVAHYKKLRGGVVFVDSIPRVPAGKILRRLLKTHAGHVYFE